ncbi:MAG: hypothetical protein KR126chlam3_01050 [Chlamydiae bacterium]|nr:hypothetical protein [Chlamydiota bacterium]
MIESNDPETVFKIAIHNALHKSQREHLFQDHRKHQLQKLEKFFLPSPSAAPPVGFL